MRLWWKFQRESIHDDESERAFGVFTSAIPLVSCNHYIVTSLPRDKELRTETCFLFPGKNARGRIDMFRQLLSTDLHRQLEWQEGGCMGQLNRVPPIVPPLDRIMPHNIET